MLAMRPPVPGEPITPGPGRIQTHPCSATRVTASMGRGEAVSAVRCTACSASRRDFHIRSRCIWRRYRLTTSRAVQDPSVVGEQSEDVTHFHWRCVASDADVGSRRAARRCVR